MELIDALRTTGSVRNFTDQPVPDQLLFDVLNDARFAPSGGNRQAWNVIVVKDPTRRGAIGDLYLDAWHDYVGHVLAGLIPFSPLASQSERDLASSKRSDAIERSKPNGFPETLASVPVMLVICANLRFLAATDRDLDRYQIAGGASIYPFVWSIVLAARERGLGGVMTTVATRNEHDLRAVLDLPDHVIVAAVVALGYPETVHTKLKRNAVADFATIDSFDGPAFTETAN
jgi:nitroreductase